jgi:iron complex outermembrane receptor protein
LTKGQYDTLDYSGNPAYIKNNAHSNVISVRTGVSHVYRFSEHFSNTSTLFATGIASNVSSAGGWTDKLPVNYGVRSTFDYKRKLGEKFHLSGITGIEAQRQNCQTMAYGMVKDSLASLTNPDAYNLIGAMKSNTYTISTTYSYFTEWTLKMPYKISLTAGVGVSNMNIQLNDRFYVASNNSSNPSKPHKPTVYEQSYNNNLSPKVALNKVINDQLSVYASYSVGYKTPVSSYFYIPLLGQVNAGLKPEKGTQYEVGVKGNMLNKQLTFEVAAFMTNFENKMTVVAVPNAANTATSYTYVANGGTQVNQGVEFAVRYEVMKNADGFISSLMPFVNGAYSNFTYKDFRFQQLNGSKDGIVEVDYSGKKVAGVPPLTLNAGIDIATKYGVYANLIYSYRDSVYYTSDNVDRAPSFGLLNGKIGYRKVFAKHFSVDAYLGLNNITNQQYYVMLFVNQTPDVYIPGPNKMNFFGGSSLKYIF